MKKFIAFIILALASVSGAKAFLVEEGHFVIDIPDQFKEKTVKDDGWTTYETSFKNQGVSYMFTTTSVSPRTLLDTLGYTYMAQQSAPGRGRICGEKKGEGFMVVLFNPDNENEICVIGYFYDDHLPYQSVLRKFNENVSCSRYVR